MDFIFSLGFLVLTMVLAAGYVALAYVLVLTPGMLWRRYRPQSQKDGAYERRWKLKFNKKVCLFLVAVTLSFCLLNYSRNRSEWMGKDNAHYDAKEYFVVGQVVFGMRVVLTNFLHPDNPVLWPLNLFQEWIFHVGSKRLPEGDGEVGIWVDEWFVYPYSKRYLDPYGTNVWKRSPGMIALLNKAWFSIETVATKPIADKKMRYQHYYRNFPRMLFYYCLRAGYLTGQKMGSGKALTTDPVYVTRSLKIVEWIGEMRKRWAEHEPTREFVKENPKVEATMLTCLIMEYGHVLLSDILAGRFRCDKPYLDQIVEVVNEFGQGVKGQKPAYLRMKQQDQAQSLYGVAVESMQSRFMMYALSEYCGKRFFLTKEQILWEKGWGDQRKSIEHLFKEELKMLKEAVHG